jgi:hypothetical protein
MVMTIPHAIQLFLNRIPRVRVAVRELYVLIMTLAGQSHKSGTLREQS